MSIKPNIALLIALIISLTTTVMINYAYRRDAYLFHYGNKTTIMDRLKSAERHHEIFSGEQIIHIAKNLQKNNSLNSFIKLELVRELVYQQIINNQDNMDILDTNKLLFAAKTPESAISNIINTMNQQNQGIRCAGTATILALLYRVMGYHVWLYAYGSPNPDSHLTHTLTLVEVNKKIYLEDGYFNYAYGDNNNLIPFEEVLTRNKQGKVVHMLNGQLNFRRNVLSPGSFLNNNCAEIKKDSSRPEYSIINNIVWSTFRWEAFSCLIKSRHEEAEETVILSKDYPNINPDYLVNYPIWFTDMQTLVYYPLNKFKDNELFVTLIKASNRSHYMTMIVRN